jgi:hypothetical protein
MLTRFMERLHLVRAARTARRERVVLAKRSVALRSWLEAMPSERRASLADDAHELRELRRKIAALTGSPECCKGCDVPVSRNAAFPGGLCCGGNTSDVFADAELVVLRLGGASLDGARVTRHHNGCAFRDVSGCTLPFDARPAVCVAYACRELRRELHRKGVLREVEALSEALREKTRELAASVVPWIDPRRAAV